MSITVMKVVKEMPNHGWLLDVMKGNRVRSTAIFPQSDAPLLVVVFVPIMVRWLGMLPYIMQLWREWMKTLPVLLVPCVGQGNVAGLL